MNLEDLLKLSVNELTRLPIKDFEELSIDERIQLIETKEKELAEQKTGPKVFPLWLGQLEAMATLEELTNSVCPELIQKREEEAYKAECNRRMKKMESRRKQLDINPRDIIYDWELENLSERQQIILNEFQNMKILTEDFRQRDLLEIFQCAFRMKFAYIDSGSPYCAEDALADALNEIKKKFPSLRSDNRFDKILIVCLSPNFEDTGYILDKGIRIIKKEYGANPEVSTHIVVALDADLRGSCDLAIRLILYRG